MYAGFYHLQADPFCLSPDPRFRFSHPSYNKAKSYMLYALQRAEGFVVVTGLPGTGKTTLIKEIIGTLNATQFNIAKLVSTQLNATDLLQVITYALGIAKEGMDKATLLLRLETFAKEQFKRGRRTLLVVDEAQDLPHGALEELRLMTNLEQNNLPLLQVFMVGQSQLLEVLQLEVLEQLKQRVVAACELKPLNLTETEHYIFHRLQIAGWKQDPVIDSDIFPPICDFTNGIPRKINHVLSRLLLHGFVENKHHLSLTDASGVISELSSEVLPDASGRSTAPRPNESEPKLPNQLAFWP